MAAADPAIAPSDVLEYWFRDPPFDASERFPEGIRLADLADAHTLLAEGRSVPL